MGRHQKYIFLVARLQNHLGSISIKNPWIFDLSRAKKYGRRELVCFSAMVFQMKPVMNTLPQGKASGNKLILSQDDISCHDIWRG